MPPLHLPGRNERIIAVIAALKDEAPYGIHLDGYLSGSADLPDAPGVYLFLYEPPKYSSLFSGCDNWFSKDVAIYAGMTGSQTLKQRLADHRSKWKQVLDNAQLLEPFGEEVVSDRLRLVVLEVPEEALVAEQTLIDAIAPIAQAPVLTKGGFGGAFSGESDQWTLLGNLAVADSMTLQQRFEQAADHVAPFLQDNESVIEEFVQDKYYETFLR